MPSSSPVPSVLTGASKTVTTTSGMCPWARPPAASVTSPASWPASARLPSISYAPTVSRISAKHLYGVISVKALVRVVLSRWLFEGRPCPRLDPGNAEAIGSALGRLSQVVVGKESIPRGARQQAQPIALAYLYSVGHGGPEP